MTEAPQAVEQQTLDSASSALGGGDPESLYRSGRAFTATADRLRMLSDEFRARLGELESSWQGPGSRAFADTATRIPHQIEELATTLTAPSYEWLCRETGDALANGQRELRQLRAERDEQQAMPAPRGDRSSPQDGQAQQVMNELGNTYRQLGDQLRPLAEDGPGTPGVPQAPNSGTGAHLEGASGGGQGDPHVAAPGDPVLANAGNAAMPAGGVLGKAPKTALSQDTSGADNAEAPRGTLGRSEATSPQPAASPHAALAMTGGALGASERTHRKSHAPTERMEAEESDRSGVLGGDKRPSQQPSPNHARGADDSRQAEGDHRPIGGGHGHDHRGLSDTDAEHAATPATPAPAPPPPTTTSAPPPAPQEATPAAAPAQMPATAAADAGPAAAQPPAQPGPSQPTPAHSGTAASPLPHGTGGLDSGVSLANAGSPTPPHPAPTADQPAAPQAPGSAGQGPESGTGMPPPHGMGGGGASADAGERDRSTWLTERTDTWERDNWSGVLGR